MYCPLRGSRIGRGIWDKTFAFLQFASNQATSYPKLCSFAEPVKKEITVHREASTNDGAHQGTAYADDCGENRHVHSNLVAARVSLLARRLVIRQRGSGAAGTAASAYLNSPSGGAHTVLKMSAWPPSKRGSSGEAFALFITVPLPMSWLMASAAFKQASKLSN